MGDLPVMKGCIIRANDRLGRKNAITIEEVRHSYPRAPGSSAVGVVNIDTVVIPTRSARVSLDKDNESDVLSVTTAVEAIIRNLVIPAVSVTAAH